jgi:tRNA dimethylallyltransferase
MAARSHPAAIALSIAPIKGCSPGLRGYRTPVCNVSSDRFPLLVIAGPTGSGKSALALYLASELRGEIVNYDSVQVYRGLDIGSAKTPLSERRGIPHHVIDILAPEQELTAGAYARLARPVLRDIAGRGKLPVLAGGTGFYLRALLDGLSPAPPRDPALRQRLAEIARRRPAALHRFLRRIDAEAARRIHPNDRQKLMRAIELARAERLPRDPLTGFRVLKIGLNPDRKQLYARINRRTQQLFAGGLLEETASLLRSGLPPDAKALQTLGYRQAVQVLTGKMSLAAAIEECQTKTRQYAKRQLTWFRAERDITWLDGFGDDPNLQITARALPNL